MVGSHSRSPSNIAYASTDRGKHLGGYPKFVSEGWNDHYLPVWLQAAGYNTYYAGKLMNGHSTSNYNKPFPKGWNSTNCEFPICSSMS